MIIATAAAAVLLAGGGSPVWDENGHLYVAAVSERCSVSIGFYEGKPLEIITGANGYLYFGRDRGAPLIEVPVARPDLGPRGWSDDGHCQKI